MTTEIKILLTNMERINYSGLTLEDVVIIKEQLGIAQERANHVYQERLDELKYHWKELK